MEKNDENKEPIMVFPPSATTHKLAEHEYFGTIGKIRTELKRTKRDRVIRKVWIPFQSVNEPYEIVFEGEFPITYGDRFYRFLKELLGGFPDKGYDLRNLEGCETSFSVIRCQNLDGKIWSEIRKATIFY